MKKQSLFLTTILLLSLTSCAPASGSDAELLKLHDSNTKFVISGYGKDEYVLLPTYHHKNNGEAPYINLATFIDINNILFHNSIDYMTMTSKRLPQYDSQVKKIANHLYGIYSEEVLGATIDTAKNVLTIKRYDYMNSQPSSFNGSLRNDIASPNNSEVSLVHGSIRSNYLGDFKEEKYELDNYDMDIVEINDKIYMPAQLIFSIFFRSSGTDLVYNGNDFFVSSSASSSSTYPHVAASFRSTKNTFEIEGVLYSPVSPLEGESHRYVGYIPATEGKEASYGIFSLTKDGKGFLFTSPSPDTQSSENPKYRLEWEKKNNDIYVTLYSAKTLVGPGRTMRISSNETFFNKKTRSEALAKFNYNLLRFQIDNLYGLKDELNNKHGFSSFDSFVTKKGLKTKLLSKDTNEYDEGLSEFLMKYIDDGHTTYGDRSVFTGHVDVTASDLSKRYMGPRRSGLFSKLAQYTEDRKTALGEDVKPLGVFMEDETAVIRFDSFTHFLPIIAVPDEPTNPEDIPDLLENSSPHGFIASFEEIAKHDEIKNVVIDLTCNGGGAVLTIPFLAAYFTKDPTICVHDTRQDVVREFHYDVDLNYDGIYGGEEDTLADKYHFYLLTSDFSFSCASAYPTVAHIAGVDVIGMQSGGGACNVAAFADACGSIYTLSAPQQIGYIDENGKFINDDAGIPVTHAVDKDCWYDLVKLNAAIKGFSSNN